MFYFPQTLREAILKLMEGQRMASVGEAHQELSERYRSGRRLKSGYMSTSAHHLAYLNARMPATFSVISRVLGEILHACPREEVGSLLDLGAGPGSVLWAASEVLPAISRYHLVERDPGLMEMGKRLAAHHPSLAAQNAVWQCASLESLQINSLFDLVTLSYVIGELPDDAAGGIIRRAWEAAGKFLVLIEPGTPIGFERIRAARTFLISMGAHILAPCPHANECPMSGGDWCHFSQRLERSVYHKHLKQAALGYEDEKFSYLAASKVPVPLPAARILRHPAKRSGHIHFTLCAPDGLKERVATKKNSLDYKQLRKLDWGDRMPE